MTECIDDDLHFTTLVWICFFFKKWDKNSIRKLKSLLLSLLFSLWLLKWKSSSLHSADATFVLLTCNLSVTMLIVLSLCESKPSHWPAQCHVGTQWCIYSVQIHGRALTCFIVHYVDLHRPCMGAEGRAGTTGRNRATVYLADFSLSAAHVVMSLVRLHTWWIQSVRPSLCFLWVAVCLRDVSVCEISSHLLDALSLFAYR